MRKPRPEELRQVVEFFPIGKKIRYSPEYKKEVILDTLIVAYCVDGEYIYSWDAIEFDDRGYSNRLPASAPRRSASRSPGSASSRSWCPTPRTRKPPSTTRAGP